MNYSEVYQIVLKTKDIILSDVSGINLKGIGDFVTNVDLHVNDFLKHALSTVYPSINFFSEEEENCTLTDNCWIVDPIDGTTNLVFGHNMSALSLAHYLNGEVQFGIVFNPFNDEVFSAIKGHGAYLNQDKKLEVSKRSLAESLIECGSNPYNKSNAKANFQLSLELFQKSLDIRMMRSSALAICYVAAARLDGYVEELLKPWDYAAASLILSEAGGYITNFQGTNLNLDKPSSLVASNDNNQKELFDIVHKYYS